MTAAPRISVFLQDLAGGGAERVMVNLCGGLASAGMSVDLVLVRQEGPFLGDVSPAVRIVDLGTRRVIRSIGPLARYLKRERPRAVLSALPHVNVAAILAVGLARTGTRVVITEHSYPEHARREQSLSLARFGFSLMPWLYRRADEIVAVSRGVADNLADVARLDRNRIRTIYNAVVNPGLESLAAQPVNHPWFEPGKPPVILAVGRLVEAKAFETLIKAFACLRRRRDARLVILGDGPQRPMLEASVHRLGLVAEVSLPGFQSNPYAWMSRAAVLALSSTREGLPTVLIEAMACGTPVVATDCKCGPAEVLEGGRYGAMVPVGDAEALATAIDRTIQCPLSPEQLQERAGLFSLDSIVKEYIPLLLGDDDQ